MQDQLKRMAKQWYGTTGIRDVEDRRLLQALAPEISEDWQPDEVGRGMDSGTGEWGTGGKKGTPEEQVDANYDAWHPDDKEMRDSNRLSGKANAIDVYMRSRDGNIYRMDVTAMTLQSGGHHGLGAAFATEGSAEESEMIQQLESGHYDQLESNLLNYFQNIQSNNWNPVIRNIVDQVAREKSENTASMIADLRSGRSTLAQTTQQLRDMLVELRGGSAGAGPASRGGGISGALQLGEARSIVQAAKGSSKAAKNLSNSVDRAVGRDLGYRAYDSAIAFALHMFGNIMELFRSDSAVQGGYSTGYGLGRGVAANFTVEVKHKIHASGESVLEFMDLKQQDVILHHASSLTEAYKRDLWWGDQQNVNELASEEARRLNLDWAANQVGGAMESVEVNTIVTSAYDDSAAKAGPIMSGASVISPQGVNNDITEFIKGLDAPLKYAQQGAHSLLKPHIKNLSNMFDLGEEGSTSRAWEDRVGIEQGLQHQPGGSLNPRNTASGYPMNSPSALDWAGWDEMGIGESDPSTVAGWRAEGYSSFKDYHAQKIAPASGLQGFAVRNALNNYGKRRMTKNMPLMDEGGVYDAMESGWASQSAYSFNMMTRTQGRLSGRGMADSGKILSASGNKAKYWGLAQYMDTQQATNFNEQVTPQFWAAPYLGILYPSTQL